MEPPTPGADAPERAPEPAAPAPAATPLAPAVVAVVVARDPGDWFEEAIAALADQDYPNLSILVIDANSAEPVKPRVADGRRPAPSCGGSRRTRASGPPPTR